MPGFGTLLEGSGLESMTPPEVGRTRVNLKIIIEMLVLAHHE